MSENFSVTFEDMYNAYLSCRKNKRNKMSAKKFELNALYNIQTLCMQINARCYKLKPAQCFIVKDPTIREVFCADFRDRVVQHFVFNELNPVIDKMLIYDAANCRVNKGTDFAIDRVSKFVRCQTCNYTRRAYYLKVDLSGFFMSIDRDYLLEKVFDVINNHYKGNYKEELKYLVEIIIKTNVTRNCRRISSVKDWKALPKNKTLFNNPYGLPIGNICSQLFANLYLNDLDHFIKSRHRHYSRYVDDMIIVDSSKNHLKETLSMIEKRTCSINMHINYAKTKIEPVSFGIHYLGVFIYPYYRVLSKKRIFKMYKSSKQFKDITSAYKSASSRLGYFKRYSGYRLMRRWYNSFDEDIKRRLKIKGAYGFMLLKSYGS